MATAVLGATATWQTAAAALRPRGAGASNSCPQLRVLCARGLSLPLRSNGRRALGTARTAGPASAGSSALRAFNLDNSHAPQSALEGGGGGGGAGGLGGTGGSGGSGEGGGKMNNSQFLTLAYAAIIVVGGIIGYTSSQSGKSLISSLLTGAALVLAYRYMPSHPALGSGIGLAVSAVLLFVMGQRYRSSGQFFPAGFVSLLSLLMGGSYVHGIARTTK